MARLLYLHSAIFLGFAFPVWLAAGPIHDAAFFGKLDTIQTLLDGGADIDERDTFDRTALHRAAGKSSPEVAEFLISKGADLEARTNSDYWAPRYTPYDFAKEWQPKIRAWLDEVKAAASSVPKTPKTPHSSRNLSGSA